jgi:CBS domain containing-hemolysin-like protein
MNDSDDPPESKGLLSRLRERLRSRDAEAELRNTIEELIEEREVPLAPIGAQERTLIANVFKLRELTAYDVMVPRADIVAVASDVSFAQLMRFANREAHSRLPVYRESLDDVIGMVHVKDLLSYWSREKDFKIEDVMRKVLFVAPSMRVLDLLLEMRKTRLHMALVVDEYGGVDGLVTIEDVVEEIVGEIEDEHDVDEGPRLALQPDGSYLADARLPIADFEERVGPILTAEERDADIDTLGGLAVAQAGYLPARGEIIRHGSGYEFEVLEADPRRLKRLRVRPPKPAASEDG